jgi:hypothetical protein
MKMTEAADRLEALQRRRIGSVAGKRRRPAEASRLLIAGAGTAAVLTMMTAMAQADQAVEAASVAVAESPLVGPVQALGAVAPSSPAVTEAPTQPTQAVQTITVARPVRAQISNGRTSASR